MTDGVFLTARLRIRWGDYCLIDRYLPARASFELGEEGADFALPSELLGAPRVTLVAGRAGKLEVGLCPRARVEYSGAATRAHRSAGDRIQLVPESRIVQRLGEISLEVSGEPGAPPRVSCWVMPWRPLAYFVLSAMLHATALALLARSTPPSLLERTQERLSLMRYYLRLSAENDPRKDPKGEGTNGRKRLGDDAGLGLDLQTVTREHVRNQGPKDNPEPQRSWQPGAGLAWPYPDGFDPVPPFGYLESYDPAGGDTSLGVDEDSLRLSRGPGAPGQWIRRGDRGKARGQISQRIADHEYAPTGDNPVHDPRRNAWSTFDPHPPSGSYLLARAELRSNRLPRQRAIRTEEFVNHFDYDYEPPGADEGAFRPSLAAAPSPYDPGHHLLRVGIQGSLSDPRFRPPLHLVYLVGLGPRATDAALSSIRAGLEMALRYLRPGDTVALCGEYPVREVLPPTGIEQIDRIRRAVSQLRRSSLEEGLPLAYQVAERGLVAGHVTEVVVIAANRDFPEAERIQGLGSVATRACGGVGLSIVDLDEYGEHELGWDLALAGGGKYWHLAARSELPRVLRDQILETVPSIAQDVAVRVEFDPTQVAEYRLLGSESQRVQPRDTAQIGCHRIAAGHSVTAFYDVVLREHSAPPVNVRVRYRQPGTSVPHEVQAKLHPADISPSFEAAEPSFRLGVAVTGFAEILRGSPRTLGWSLERARAIARSAPFPVRSRAASLPAFEPRSAAFRTTGPRMSRGDPELVQLMDMAARLRASHAR